MFEDPVESPFRAAQSAVSAAATSHRIVATSSKDARKAVFYLLLSAASLSATTPRQFCRPKRGGENVRGRVQRPGSARPAFLQQNPTLTASSFRALPWPPGRFLRSPLHSNCPASTTNTRTVESAVASDWMLVAGSSCRFVVQDGWSPRANETCEPCCFCDKHRPWLAPCVLWRVLLLSCAASCKEYPLTARQSPRIPAVGRRRG